MNRTEKKLGIISNLLLLGNLAAFFLPIVTCTKENYPTLQWSEFDYLQALIKGNIPYHGDIVKKLAGQQGTWIICLMLLPAVLVLLTVVWGLVTSFRQLIKSIPVFVVLGIYTGMVLNLGYLFPTGQTDYVYSQDIAGTVHLAVSGAGVFFAVLAIVFEVLAKKREIHPEKFSEIPQVAEIKQEQVEARYSILTGEDTEKSGTGSGAAPVPEYVPGNPRGVLVGLKGLYAGAEIPVASGEYVTLGRLPSNHLVFEGQSKVSRNHCKIRWDEANKKFYFIDTSSNGTFANGSEDCLPQNLEMELPLGTVIAIGDEANMFRLE